MGEVAVLRGRDRRPVRNDFRLDRGALAMFADFMRLQGAFQGDDMQARCRWRRPLHRGLTSIPVMLYFCCGENPVAMVKWGGFAQTWMLPVLSFGAVYLMRRHLPKELNATRLGTALLWIGAIVITGFVLVSEARRWGLLG